jgi:hypothetical protein
MSKKELEQTQQTQHQLNEAAVPDNSKELTQAQLQRRRALIAGLAAAPAVLSLMNRSAWGAANNAHLSCNLVLSYVQAGNRWASPRPANENGTLKVTWRDINKCNK